MKLPRSFSQATHLYVRDVGSVAGANFVTLLVSMATVLLLPRVVSVADYGYFQLYLLVASLAGFLHLGWADGLYLVLGGRRRSTLDRTTFRSDFWLFIWWQVALAAVGASLVWVVSADPQRRLVWFSALVAIALANVRVYAYYAYQAVGSFKRYVYASILDRGCFLVFTALGLLVFPASFVVVIIADILGRLLSMLYILAPIRPRARRGATWTRAFRFSAGLVAVGVPLMIANFAGQLGLALGRFAIDLFLGIEQFSGFSLAASLAALTATFAAALSLPLFPRLRRAKSGELLGIYRYLRPRAGAVMLTVSLTYPLTSFGMARWFPQYDTAVPVLAILFPLVIYQAESAILFTTFLKSGMAQTSLLGANLLGLAICAVLAMVGAGYFRSVEIAAFGILIGAWAQARASEVALARKLGSGPLLEAAVEDSCVLAFVAVQGLLVMRPYAWAWVSLTVVAIFVLLLLAHARRLGAGLMKG